MRAAPPRRPWGRPWGRPQDSVIKPLIIANVVIFVLTGFGRSTVNDVNPLLEMITLHPIYIRQFQVWRLGTYMFAHGGFAHLLFNMWGLFIFGIHVERVLGAQRFLRLYLISGLVGGLAWLAANWSVPTAFDIIAEGQRLRVMGTGLPAAHAANAEIVRVFGGVIGASGCVFGVMLAAAMTFPNLQVMLLFPPIPMKLRTLVIAYAGIEIFLAWQQTTGHSMSRIAHLAHLGGLLGAFFYLKSLGHRGLFKTLRTWFDGLLNATKNRGNGGGRKPPPTPAEVDRVLDKIGQYGIDSLTPDERRILQQQGKRLKTREGR